jgi:hypothetical protein
VPATACDAGRVVVDERMAPFDADTREDEALGFALSFSRPSGVKPGGVAPLSIASISLTPALSSPLSCTDNQNHNRPGWRTRERKRRTNVSQRQWLGSSGVRLRPLAFSRTVIVVRLALARTSLVLSYPIKHICPTLGRWVRLFETSVWRAYIVR